VQVFGPETSTATIKEAVDAAYAENGGHSPPNHGEFSSKRYAFLFKPGLYDVEVPVGFYTQVLGLGESPSNVVFTSPKGVYCEEGDYKTSVGALDTFWRSAENFRTAADYEWFGGLKGMLWAVSQASPMRSVEVVNDLILYQYVQGDYDAGFASGGYMANSQVSGTVWSGSQQQWFTRNSDVTWVGGVWNMVFVGTNGAPSSHCGHNSGTGAQGVPMSTDGGLPYVTVGDTPLIAEKPYITIDPSTGLYSLNVPLVKQNSRGSGIGNKRTIDFSQVYVANADTDTASTINVKLAAGLHVVLSAGIYHLDSPLELKIENQVLLGLGLATLVATSGSGVVKVGNVDGVVVAGVLLEAGSQATEALLVWGDGSFGGSSSNPGRMHDVFARSGGPHMPINPQVDVMIKINSGWVIGDNLWLWRADHCDIGPVTNGTNPALVGMIVNGNDVSMYGLAVEHVLTDGVQWNGERGSTYFFQCELPYDVPLEWGAKKFVGYRVGANVTQHSSHGAGVYHYFRDFPVVVETGISAPVHLQSSFVSPLSVGLNGLGTMKHVLNDLGGSTEGTKQGADVAWVCDASSGWSSVPRVEV